MKRSKWFVIAALIGTMLSCSGFTFKDLERMGREYGEGKTEISYDLTRSNKEKQGKKESMNNMAAEKMVREALRDLKDSERINADVALRFQSTVRASERNDIDARRFGVDDLTAGSTLTATMMVMDSEKMSQVDLERNMEYLGQTRTETSHLRFKDDTRDRSSSIFHGIKKKDDAMNEIREALLPMVMDEMKVTGIREGETWIDMEVADLGDYSELLSSLCGDMADASGTPLLFTIRMDKDSGEILRIMGRGEDRKGLEGIRNLSLTIDFVD